MALTPEEAAELQDLERQHAEITQQMLAEKTSMQAPEESDGALRTFKDTGLGALQGVTLGGADELQAILRAAVEADPSKYREYQQEAEQMYNQAQERSPWAYGAGEIGAGIGAGLLTGGAGLTATAGGLAKAGAKEIAKAGLKAGAKGAGIGAVAGALGSKGNLSSEETAGQLGKDIAMGGALGGTLGTAMETIAPVVGRKVGEFVEETPFLRQAKLAFNRSTEGKKTSAGERIQDVLGKEKGMIAGEGANELLNVEQKLGRNISDVLAKSPNKVQYNASDKAVFNEIAEKLDDSAFRNRVTGEDMDTDGFFKLLEKADSPLEANDLRKRLKKLANSFDPKSDEFNKYMTASENIKKRLTLDVPGFKEANKLFNEFRVAGPETILHKGTPTEFRPKVWFGDVKDKKNKLYNDVKTMYDEMNRGSEGSYTAKNTFNRMMENLKGFQETNADDLARLGIVLDPQRMRAEGLKRGDISSLSRKAAVMDPHSGSPGIGRLAVSNESTTGRGLAFGGVSVAGSAVSSAPVKIARKLYNVGEDKLMEMGQKLLGDNRLKNQGQALMDAINSKNQARKNAILFSLAQRPEAREVMDALTPDIDSDKLED